jgi:iron complex outermembrane recepter protein
MQAPRAIPPLARFPLHCIAAAVACACADLAAAADTVRSAPVVVTATRVEQSSLDVPAAIDSIDSRDMTEARLQANISETMQRVPGTYVQSRETYAQEQQITVRGFGARSQFGTRGVRLYVDGIPASTPDGQGGSGLFDYSSAKSIEVLRGPFSALYGNHSGGVVQILTEDGPQNPTASGSFSIGSYGTQRYGLKFGGQYGNVNAVASGSYLTTDGYRDRSASERYLFNSKFGIKLDDRASLTITASYLDQPLDQDPLTLSATQVAQNRRQANPNSYVANARRSLDNKQVGLVYDLRISDQDSIRLLTYGGQRNNLGFLFIAGTPGVAGGLPGGRGALSSGGVSQLARDYGGVGGRWTRTTTIFNGQPLTFTAGADYDVALEDRKGFVNDNGNIGALKRNEFNRASSWGTYGQAEWTPIASVTGFAGLRYTSVKMQSSDYYVVGTNPNDSGKTDFAAVTPVVGALVRVTPLTNVYLNAGRSFETPTLIELAYRSNNATGLNFALQPSTSNHYELGVKSLIGESTRVNAAVFQVYTNNEIVVDVTSAGRTSFKNAGKTERQGIEVSGNTDLGMGFGAFASYTFLKATFRDPFSSTVNNVGSTVASGNQIPGVPRSLLYVDLTWRDPVGGWFAGVEHRRASKVYANDVNTAFANGYKLTDLRMGINRDLDPFTVQLFVRVNNVFGERYIGGVAVNDANNQFYAPAPERNYLAGVSASMKF